MTDYDPRDAAWEAIEAEQMNRSHDYQLVAAAANAAFGVDVETINAAVAARHEAHAAAKRVARAAAERGATLAEAITEARAAFALRIGRHAAALRERGIRLELGADLLTSDDVAAELGVGKRRAQQLIDAHPEAVSVGRERRIHPSVLVDLRERDATPGWTKQRGRNYGSTTIRDGHCTVCGAKAMPYNGVELCEGQLGGFRRVQGGGLRYRSFHEGAAPQGAWDWAKEREAELPLWNYEK